MNRNQKILTLLPSQQLLQQIWAHLINRPRKRGEYKKNISECLFLLGWKVGLRISEAISFDLNLVNPEEQFQNLYLVCVGKDRKNVEFMWVVKQCENYGKESDDRTKPNVVVSFLFSSKSNEN
jgi:hypothetical protein